MLLLPLIKLKEFAIAVFLTHYTHSLDLDAKILVSQLNADAQHLHQLTSLIVLMGPNQQISLT